MAADRHEVFLPIDGLTIAIVIAVGLVVACLLVAVSILVSVRLRRSPAGEG